ncbi:hypothetical protein TNCT_373791 [Trichonephila clavata]|uniref:Uncharacterized protein n=1 Tax=Trichonephila clavata TaxID=2740835 RepID=A0A8X6I1E4_TRICU|nr:hypothetical protein TNCT_373791 [Trichonephila clavata]
MVNFIFHSFKGKNYVTLILYLNGKTLLRVGNSRRIDEEGHFNSDDEDHFLGIDAEDGHEDEEPLPPLALPLQNGRCQVPSLSSKYTVINTCGCTNSRDCCGI